MHDEIWSDLFPYLFPPDPVKCLQHIPPLTFIVSFITKSKI